MLLTTTITVPAVAWPLIPALAASAVRLTFTALALRPVIKG
jgi:hypothetical protein